MGDIKPSYVEFYDDRHRENYGLKHSRPEEHSHYECLRGFIENYRLSGARCLEIGSSTGLFQGMVNDYWGTDIAEITAPYYHKPYRVARGERYPFDDEMFDAIWTIAVYEHIPHLQQALLEIKSCSSQKATVFLHPLGNVALGLLKAMQ
jgi:hypothetical protein